jgi:hypothetical protein
MVHCWMVVPGSMSEVVGRRPAHVRCLLSPNVESNTACESHMQQKPWLSGTCGRAPSKATSEQQQKPWLSGTCGRTRQQGLSEQHHFRVHQPSAGSAPPPHRAATSASKLCTASKALLAAQVPQQLAAEPCTNLLAALVVPPAGGVGFEGAVLQVRGALAAMFPCPADHNHARAASSTTPPV